MHAAVFRAYPKPTCSHASPPVPVSDCHTSLKGESEATAMRIRTSGAHDELEHAQTRLSGLSKDRQLPGRRLLAYGSTGFHTCVASANSRNHPAWRSHHKQGHHNLRQAGVSYELDGGNGLGLRPHVYRGDVADADELPAALPPPWRLTSSARCCSSPPCCSWVSRRFPPTSS
jgi:hypothetical protein